MFRILVTVVGVSVLACGGVDDPRKLSSASAYQDLFWSYCLPFAEVLTDLAEDAETRQAVGAAVECPEGGTATYDDKLGQATLTNCAGVGVSVSGTLSLISLESGEQGVSPGQASIASGALTIEGGFEGVAEINSGTMSWELPVADATTFWELRVLLNGTEQCIWSGAEQGPCPVP